MLSGAVLSDAVLSGAEVSRSAEVRSPTESHHHKPRPPPLVDYGFGALKARRAVLSGAEAR